jgi:hypothetical protein
MSPFDPQRFYSQVAEIASKVLLAADTPTITQQ